jgi:polyisoprenoid-binding protein YceI
MKKIIFLGFCFFTSVVFARVSTYKIKNEKSSVEFEAVGNPSLLNVKGTKAHGEGNLTLADGVLIGEVSVLLTDLDTDMDTRNEHMKEKYLEVGKPGFNKAILKINSKINDLKSTSINQEIDATLLLHGKENKVKCKSELKLDNDGSIVGNVKFTVKLSEYGIEVPSFAGITIENDVKINANFVAILESLK